MHEAQVFNPVTFDKLTGIKTFYTMFVTFYEAINIENTYGENEPFWSPLIGHTDIPCRLSPKSAAEKASENQVYTQSTHHLALAGYYPSITSLLQARVNGIDYLIDGVEWDGNRQMTRVWLRLVTL